MDRRTHPRTRGFMASPRTALHALALLLLLVLHGGAAPAQALSLLRVKPAAGGDSPPLELFVSSATFGPQLPHVTSDDGTATPLQLAGGFVTADCMRVDGVPESLSRDFAVLLDRGGSCSFVQKTLAAQTIGASLVVVADTVDGAYASSKQIGQAIYDCSLGEAVVHQNATPASSYPAVSGSEVTALCSGNMSCVTETCVYTGTYNDQRRGFQVCCLQNTLVRLGVDATGFTLASEVRIPAVFASFRDASTLRGLLAIGPVSVAVFDADESPWNVSMLLSWLLGVLVVIGGAYCSSTEERSFSYQKVALGHIPLEDFETGYVSIDDNGDRPRVHRNVVGNSEITSSPPPGVIGDDDCDDVDNDATSLKDKLELSVIHALYFVIGASSMLLMLYYGHLGLVMNVLFVVATTASMTQVVILPVLLAVLPVRALRYQCCISLCSMLVSAAISIYWFLRRSSPFIWPLQDLLCISLCFVAIDSIQLPSLRVATVLLAVAFLYDVFFVYISPLIFGSSVMVDVASGGGNVSVQDSDYCASNPLAAECYHERIPMVLSVPLLFSLYGGNALLGLGDLILPGLLVSFCIRYDYCMGYALSKSYFSVASASYAVGLLLANVMAIALRDVIEGQPALMYIVPLMLGCIVSLALEKGELQDMWLGPQCLRMASDELRESVRRGETEPFLKKQ